MVFATLAFLGAFVADQGLLTYFADLSGPGLAYLDLDLFGIGQTWSVNRACLQIQSAKRRQSVRRTAESGHGLSCTGE